MPARRARVRVAPIGRASRNRLAARAARPAPKGGAGRCSCGAQRAARGDTMASRGRAGARATSGATWHQPKSGRSRRRASRRPYKGAPSWVAWGRERGRLAGGARVGRGALVGSRHVGGASLECRRAIELFWRAANLMSRRAPPGPIRLRAAAGPKCKHAAPVTTRALFRENKLARVAQPGETTRKQTGTTRAGLE